MSSDSSEHTQASSGRLSGDDLPVSFHSRVRHLKILTGLAVLPLIALVVAAAQAGRDNWLKLALLGLLPLGMVALGWLALRFQASRMRKDPELARRQLNRKAQRVYVIGTPIAYVLGKLVAVGLGLDGGAEIGVAVGVVAVLTVPMYFIAKRFDPRTKPFGRPEPLSEDDYQEQQEREKVGDRQAW